MSSYLGNCSCERRLDQVDEGSFYSFISGQADIGCRGVLRNLCLGTKVVTLMGRGANLLPEFVVD